MELNWSTFFLEIVNFLVLVWLVQRYFYRPVRQIVDRRREEIEARLAEAETLRQQALATQQRYEGRLAEWEAEKRQAFENLQQELEAERKRRLDVLADELKAERKKAEELWEWDKKEQARQLEEQALALGAAFVAKLLKRLADRHLHQRLLAQVLEDLALWPAEKVAELARAWQANPAPVTVISAFPLDEEERLQIGAALNRLLAAEVEPSFAVDPDLLAGVRIDLGAYVLRANLNDELEFFAHGYDDACPSSH